MVDDKVNDQLENKTNIKKIFSTSETIVLVFAALLVGLSIGLLYNKKNIVNTKVEKNDQYLNEFIKNYNYVVDNYYEEVDKESLINSAIKGMMQSLDDPYSVYIDEEESNNFNITLNGSYEGLGVQISKDIETNYILITAVFKDSPASEAGLIPGDLIVSLDDIQSSELTASEFSSLVKSGDKDTYQMKILRDGEEKNITITRKMVTLTSVISETYEQDNKKIGYIYIGIFANNTYDQFSTELKKLESEGIDYLIIDVRGNTGGHLTTVDAILDLFLNRNQIMYQFEQSGKITPIYGSGTDNKKYKIVLLGDEGSASASEVLIGGLKDNLDAIFIGKQTYGKGTVQELVTLSDGTQYKITIKKWLTPNGTWINDTGGIKPDIEVELDSKYYETYDSQEDTQLQAALDYINNN